MNQLLPRGPYCHCLESDEIRLFKLTLPPSGRDPTAQLEGRVEIFKFDGQKPNYRALSYRWGIRDAATDPHILVRDGSTSQRIRIPRNLYDYLITIESTKTVESRWMWIDSICINQYNDQEALRERGRQVACMDRIYSSANVVTIWLGPCVCSGTKDFKGPCACSGIKMFENPVRWLKEYLKVKPGFRPWEPEHLNTIREDMYWCRLWIIQEICKAESLKILRVRRGSVQIRGDQLLRLLQRHPKDDSFDLPLRLLTDRDEPKSLPELMERYYLWQCSWPRDTVFALLALAHQESEQELLRIPVDYNMPWDVLHHELIRADANRPWNTFRFSEFLHRRFRLHGYFKALGSADKSNLDEEQKRETCDVMGFYVGRVQKTVSMCCNTNRELDEYVRNGLDDIDLRLGGIKGKLESFHQDVQGIQLKTFAGSGADTFIYTDVDEFKDTLYHCWMYRDMDREHQPVGHEDADPSLIPDRQPQEHPRSSRHGSPANININVRHIGVSPTHNSDRPRENAPVRSTRPPTTRQWFLIKHPKLRNSMPCVCTGVTYGRELRESDLVFQFQDSDFALLARPRNKAEVDEDWAPYRIIGRAVIARGCCHRPEASKREIDNTSFSFRALEPGNTDMFPRLWFRMTVSSLVELTRLIESVKEN